MAEQSDYKPEQRDQVKALGKGLHVLAELNRWNGLSVSEVSSHVHMPRPSVARLVNTLQAAGYVYQCQADHKYRVTAKVRRLTSGYSASRWLLSISQPVAEQLAKQLGWPAMVARFDQRRVKLVFLTDTKSTVLVERSTLGEDISLVGSALGVSFLAFASEDPIESIIHATRTDDAKGEQGRIDNLRRLEELIAVSRRAGFVVNENSNRTAVAAPIRRDSKVVASIGVRMPLSLHQIGADLDQISAAVCEAAAQISAELA